jgi:uncharacterized cysteine cluster protein YcgN (CxxCxxCC family)
MDFLIFSTKEKRKKLVDFGRWHVHQSQWDTICEGSGRCGWMKPFFRCFFFTY